MVLQQKKSLQVEPAICSISQLVGRQREFGLMRSQYEAAQDGNGSIALLVGEPGIGKTRLLDEFSACATAGGAIVLRGGASEADGMPPYLPFLEAIGKYIRVTPQDLLREQVAHAPHTLLSIFPELAVLLGDMPAAHPLLLEQARLRLYEAIGLFLENMSVSQVLVLVLDDLQWADSASLDLLCYITRHHSNAKLLILGAYRESEIDLNPALGRTLARLNQQRTLNTISVDPLTAEEIEELAINFLQSPIGKDISVLLYTQSEGNPFFTEELLHGWVETKALVKEKKQWVAVTSLEGTMPSSITGALRRRFALLSAETINHLRIAAIIGRTFDLLLLALVEGQEIESIEDQLIEAEHAQLIHHVQAGTFTFNHDKIRTCLYMEVSSSRRRRLHEAIGSILEAQYKAQSTKCAYLLAAIAFHFMNSGDTARAVTYATQAGEQALRSQAIEEAKSYYEMALQSLEPNDQRYGMVLLGLSQVALQVGDEQEAVAICENMLTWLAVPGRPESIGLAMAALELCTSEPGSHKHTLQVLQSAQNVFEKLNIREAAGHVHSRLRKLAAQSHSERTFSGMIQTKPAAKATVQPLPANLTKSEAKVLQLVVGGKRNRQIAEELGISEKTVANHLSHIFNKTTSENRAAATAFAIHHGIA